MLYDPDIVNYLNLLVDTDECSEAIRLAFDTLYASSYNIVLQKVYSINDSIELHHYINIDSSVPIKERKNVLILRGGINHQYPLENTAYAKTLIGLLPEYNAYIFVKKTPMLELYDVSNIRNAISIIKYNNDNEVIVVGFSMGGAYLLSYLSQGYDDASYYYALSCPIMLNKFNDMIKSSSMFSIYYNMSLRYNKCNTLSELLEINNICKKKYDDMINNFYKNIIESSDKWKHKTQFIIGLSDRLLASNIEQFNIPDVNVHYIPNGAHCSYDIVKCCSKFIKQRNNS